MTDLRETIRDRYAASARAVAVGHARSCCDGAGATVEIEQMLALARANTEKAGAANVEFLKGTIEEIPLPAAAIDVVISNCVINLSVGADDQGGRHRRFRRDRGSIMRLGMVHPQS